MVILMTEFVKYISVFYTGVSLVRALICMRRGEDSTGWWCAFLGWSVVCLEGWL